VVTGRDLHNELKIYSRFFGPRFLRWLTNIWMPLGKRVVIMGGGVQGCQVAEFLVKRGREVIIVDIAKEIGIGLLETLVKPHLLMWLAEKGVTMMTEVKYEEITSKGLTITTKEGKRQTIEADTIVTAMPLQPSTELFKKLSGCAPEIYAIGDCKEPNMIIDAIADGSRIGRTI
jgi:pyruvate/2-oxoglutarate dehydrogenase complex dihydrolipoamide dehydrogenase (E3) component